jgi:hypothetical protein
MSEGSARDDQIHSCGATEVSSAPQPNSAATIKAIKNLDAISRYF